MEELAETLVVEQFDQLRAIAHPLRARILELLVQRPMTMSQLGEVFGETVAKIHYHVRELEKFGFLRLVEKRERGGFIEKYYRAVAREISVAPALLRTTPPSELGQTVQGYLDEMKQELMRAIAYGDAHPEAPFCFTWGSNSLWLTQEEFKTLEQQLETLFEPFRQPRGRAEERPLDRSFYRSPGGSARDKKTRRRSISWCNRWNLMSSAVQGSDLLFIRKTQTFMIPLVTHLDRKPHPNRQRKPLRPGSG